MTTGGGESIVSTEEKWYEKYVGFPYVHLGDDPKSGIDCFNLIRYIYKHELNIDIPYDTTDFCDILDEQWYNKTHDQPFQRGGSLEYGWEPVTKPEVFNVITMNIGSTNVTNHCALYVDNNRILQTMLEHDSWIAPYGRYYIQYTMGVYKWNPTHMKL